MSRNTALTVALAAGLVLSVPGAASAASGTSTFQATAAVVPFASVTATSLAFGSYTGQKADVNSTIAVTATTGTSYGVTIDAGTAAGATATTRKLTGGPGGTYTLAYGLYTNSARTTNWGSTPATGVTGAGSGTTQVLTVYGSVPADQTSPVGSYNDTLTVVVTY